MRTKPSEIGKRPEFLEIVIVLDRILLMTMTNYEIRWLAAVCVINVVHAFWI